MSFLIQQLPLSTRTKRISWSLHTCLEENLLSHHALTLICQSRVQATMVATWLLELILDQISQALLEVGVGNEDEAGKSTALDVRIQEFLKKNIKVLDSRTTTLLLASYGRIDDLVLFASLRQVQPSSQFLSVSLSLSLPSLETCFLEDTDSAGDAADLVIVVIPAEYSVAHQT